MHFPWASSVYLALAATASSTMFSGSSSGRMMVSAFTTGHHRSFVHSRMMRSFAASAGGDDIEWTTDKVRKTFVDFFVEKHEHTPVPSSAVAPLNDPTLLFTNAGMNQFKPIFLGQADPETAMGQWKRAANSQKCIRAGGKHNDLDDVGRDTYHHTFFEMLGSWSFGDYFKKEAIDWAWILLTEVYGIPKERLYATYFEGDESLGLEPDNEAKEYWLKYLPEDRVIACNAEDNFWEMGETGPCGPCSEIHYDRIGDRDASELVNADDSDVIEIWNIVFVQYNRDEKGLSVLPNQHIDTGMGLERLVSLLQDKNSNYDIDTFQPIFRAIEKYSQVEPYTGKVLEEDVGNKDTAYRAIADHARTLTFAIADGAVPNNEGRGYVLRRVLRRATRYGQQVLKCEPGFFSKLIPVVVETFGEYYPELVTQKDTIIEIIQEEEQSFSTMLDRGIAFFSDLKDDLRKNKETVVTGDKAFFLYDTMGFPIDLTEQMAEEAGLTVDTAGFESEMESQKKRSRDARNAAKSGGAVRLELIAEQTSWLSDNNISPTDDSSKYAWDTATDSTVNAIFTEDGFLTDDSTAKVGSTVGIILDKSSFYAEAGGQDADVGYLSIVSGGKVEVKDVQTYGGYLLHTGIVTEGEVSAGGMVQCQVDYERRKDVAPNHSMTHVLNAALRQVLGDGVDQRGSLCNEEKLRFDFSHKKALSAKQLKLVEELCQQSIANSEAVTSTVMPLEEATALDGVRAVFGEVYPDPVRVVSIGSDTSVEFCGGTHVSNTDEAKAFVIVEETAVAKGIRRISAVTKSVAKSALQEGEKLEKLVCDAENSASTENLDKTAGALRKELDASPISAVLKAQLRGRIEGIQKKAMEEKKRLLAGRVDLCLNDVKEQLSTIQDNSVVMTVDIGADSKASQKIMNAAKSIVPDAAFMGISEEEPGSGGKVMVFAIVPDSLTEKLRADEWVRETLAVCGGRGGGKPGNAQGQAKECSDVNALIEAGTNFAKNKIQTTTV